MKEMREDTTTRLVLAQVTSVLIELDLSNIDKKQKNKTKNPNVSLLPEADLSRVYWERLSGRKFCPLGWVTSHFSLTRRVLDTLLLASRPLWNPVPRNSAQRSGPPRNRNPEVDRLGGRIICVTPPAWRKLAVLWLIGSYCSGEYEPMVRSRVLFPARTRVWICVLVTNVVQ